MSGQSVETDAFRRCPACGHDWSGHQDPPLIGLTCEGKRGLGYVSGCRCALTLRRVVTAALIATGKHTSETARTALTYAADNLADYDARVSNPPGQPAHLPTADDQGDGSGVGA